MTSEEAAERLRALGLSGVDVDTRRALFDLVLARFGSLGRGVPEHVFWVPGRLEVFGKHTDYAGGRTLVSAVPRGFALAISPRPGTRIEITDAARSETVSIETRSSAGGGAAADRPATGWRHYVQTVVRRLSQNFPSAGLGSDVVFASDLPRASGMSSSSALMVGVAAALGRVGGLERRPEWHDNIAGPLDAASYYACIENGSPFGSLSGDSGVGTHGGSEDHAAIVAGKPGRMSAFAFVPMRHVTDVPLPEEWRFVLTPSGIVADKTGGAKGPYNNLARGAQVMLRLWNGAEPPATSLASALASSTGAADRMRELVSRSDVDGWPASLLLKRLAHFIQEDGRIPLAVHALRDGDADAVGRLSAESQKDAETLLGNQVPETVELVRTARLAGALGASSFGAGFGGSVWALVLREDADKFAREWNSGAFVARPAPPLTQL